MVPEVGGKRAGETAASRDALLELGRRIVAGGIETLVMITPHTTVFSDAVGVLAVSRLRGDLGHFGAAEVTFDLPNDRELAAEIRARSERHGLPTVVVEEWVAGSYRRRAATDLDHGVTAPLYWLRRAGVESQLVVAGVGLLPREKLYFFGRAVRDAAAILNKKVALIASGDLSHRLIPDAPGGYSPRGREFDERVVDLIGRGEVRGLMELDYDLVEEAGECGLRPIVMMLGALDGYDFKPEVLAYEAPFGVGYMTAVLTPGKPYSGSREQAKDFERRCGVQDPVAERVRESYLVRLAREQVENIHRHGPRRFRSSVDEEVPPEFQQPGGVFVSIKKHGVLRGCIGTIEPVHPSVFEEVRHNAVAAAGHDPRFSPVRRDELDELEYSVDVLSPLEPVADLSTLDPKKYGVVVSRGNRSGVLLPDLDGIDTVEDQLAIAREKAGIPPEVPVTVRRFTVTRYH
jgi:AmmeMemoRadiSam system protein A